MIIVYLCQNLRTMANNLFNRYIWLVDTIYRTGKITFEDINRKWLRNVLSDGKKIPLRTFHNHRIAIEEMFDVNIECDKSTYEYYIDNAEDMQRGGVRTWLLNTFAVNNLINESHKIKSRIQFEHIPSGQQFLTTIIEAMRDGLKLHVSYQSFWMQTPAEFDVEPYLVKVFKQRWYLVGRSDKLRIYGLDRLQMCEISSERFKYPADFDPEICFQDCYGIINVEDIPAQDVTIRVSVYQANYIRALPLHHTQIEIQTTDIFSTFRLHLKPTFDFRQELLSLGEDVEVLQPEWFRIEMKRVVELMAGKYIKPDADS
jgi:hypothetical protein